MILLGLLYYYRRYRVTRSVFLIEIAVILLLAPVFMNGHFRRRYILFKQSVYCQFTCIYLGNIFTSECILIHSDATS